MRKKRPENAFKTNGENDLKNCNDLKTNGELSQNHTEKQIMSTKTTVNCLFNDIWCFLVIGCFGGNIGVFQQIVIKGLLYP